MQQSRGRPRRTKGDPPHILRKGKWVLKRAEFQPKIPSSITFRGGAERIRRSPEDRLVDLEDRAGGHERAVKHSGRTPTRWCAAGSKKPPKRKIRKKIAARRVGESGFEGGRGKSGRWRARLHGHRGKGRVRECSTCGAARPIRDWRGHRPEGFARGESEFRKEIGSWDIIRDRPHSVHHRSRGERPFPGFVGCQIPLKSCSKYSTTR